MADLESLSSAGNYPGPQPVDLDNVPDNSLNRLSDNDLAHEASVAATAAMRGLGTFVTSRDVPPGVVQAMSDVLGPIVDEVSQLEPIEINDMGFQPKHDLGQLTKGLGFIFAEGKNAGRVDPVSRAEQSNEGVIELLDRLERAHHGLGASEFTGLEHQFPSSALGMVLWSAINFFRDSDPAEPDEFRTAKRRGIEQALVSLRRANRG